MVFELSFCIRWGRALTIDRLRKVSRVSQHALWLNQQKLNQWFWNLQRVYDIKLTNLKCEVIWNYFAHKFTIRSKRYFSWVAMIHGNICLWISRSPVGPHRLETLRLLWSGSWYSHVEATYAEEQRSNRGHRQSLCLSLGNHKSM